MALDVIAEWPTYLVEDLPQRKYFLVLCPSVRWRAVINDVEPMGSDLLLETVSRIKASGEKSPERISELLQISKDLVQHLLAQISTMGTTLSPKDVRSLDFDQPRELLSNSTRAVWVYRDLATQEIWRNLGNETPPVLLRSINSITAMYEHGTAGRPIKSPCLLLPPGVIKVEEPTDFELMQLASFGRQDSRRAQVVGDPEFCLVARPVVKSESGVAVLAFGSNIHIGLTRYLENASQADAFIARWISKIPDTAGTVSISMQLDNAVNRLKDLLTAEINGPETEALRQMEMQIRLVLQRCVDYYRFARDAETVQKMTRDIGVWSQIGRGIGLAPQDWAVLMRASEESVCGQVALLLLEQVREERNYDTSTLMRIVRCAVALSLEDDSSFALSELVNVANEVIDLSKELIAQEEEYGQQSKKE